VTRDFVGYGERPPHAAWPGDARVAISFVRFLDEVAGRPDVWVATRGDIARHWAATHPPGGGS